MATSIARSGRAWRLVVCTDDEVIVADPRHGPIGRRCPGLRPVCGHHLGFAVLGELAAHSVMAAPERARRTCALQLHLPTDDETRSLVHEQIGRIERAT